MNIFVPMLDPNYNVASQTVSELSAIGAPTRPLWVVLGTFYCLLLIAFGWGIVRFAGQNYPLYRVGVLIIANGVMSLYWPPMHLRGTEGTITDFLHIVWAVATVLLMLFAIGFGAASQGRLFRLYSVATMIILVLFGTMTGMEGPDVAANLPTPWIGVWERISIAVFMFWIIILSLTLIQSKDTSAHSP